MRKNRQQNERHDAFRKQVLEILQESIDRYGKSKTCEMFQIGSRATLDNWLNGGYIRPSNMEKIVGLGLDHSIKSANVPFQVCGFGDQDAIYYLTEFRHVNAGEYVLIDEQRTMVGRAYPSAQNDTELSIITRDKRSMIVPRVKMRIVLGTVKFFDENYNPFKNDEAYPFAT